MKTRTCFKPLLLAPVLLTAPVTSFANTNGLVAYWHFDELPVRMMFWRGTWAARSGTWPLMPIPIGKAFAEAMVEMRKQGQIII